MSASWKWQPLAFRGKNRLLLVTSAGATGAAVRLCYCAMRSHTVCMHGATAAGLALRSHAVFFFFDILAFRRCSKGVVMISLLLVCTVLVAVSTAQLNADNQTWILSQVDVEVGLRCGIC